MAPHATQHKNLHPLTLSLTYHEGMPTKNYDDQDLLNAALTGYQTQKSEIEERITNIRQQLGQRSSGTGGGAGAAMALERPQKKRRHKISADGRRRIAEAQRKRWAATKKG